MAELCSDLAEHLEAAASVAPAGSAGAAVLEATADPEPLEPKIVERSVTTFEAQAVPSGTVSNVAAFELAWAAHATPGFGARLHGSFHFLIVDPRNRSQLQSLHLTLVGESNFVIGTLRSPCLGIKLVCRLTISL